jgi:hypothetical protein
MKTPKTAKEKLDLITKYCDKLGIEYVINTDPSKAELIELKKPKTDVVMSCGLSESEFTEREMLIELQFNRKTWFRQDQFDRLNELSQKMWNELNRVYLFDVDRSDLYEQGKPKERTRKRLIEMAECGMEEIKTYYFGYKDVTNYVHIQVIWFCSDKDFSAYMNLAKSLIKSKNEL